MLSVLLHPFIPEMSHQIGSRLGLGGVVAQTPDFKAAGGPEQVSAGAEPVGTGMERAAGGPERFSAGAEQASAGAGPDMDGARQIVGPSWDQARWGLLPEGASVVVGPALFPRIED